MLLFIALFLAMASKQVMFPHIYKNAWKKNLHWIKRFENENNLFQGAFLWASRNHFLDANSVIKAHSEWAQELLHRRRDKTECFHMPPLIVPPLIILYCHMEVKCLIMYI